MKHGYLIVIAGLVLAGCGDGTQTAETGADVAGVASAGSGNGLEGSYTASVGTASITLTLLPGMKFSLTSSTGATGTGTYTKNGDELTFNVEVNEGKPATEDDKKNPLVVTVTDGGR